MLKTFLQSSNYDAEHDRNCDENNDNCVVVGLIADISRMIERNESKRIKEKKEKKEKTKERETKR